MSRSFDQADRKRNQSVHRKTVIIMMKTEELKLTQEWDKTFPRSEKVDHSKVTVHTDLYDGGGKDAIPFDKIEVFMKENLR